MPYETIVLDREETYAVITLNRPPANAISETLMRELNAALSDVETDAAVKSVIITGKGWRYRSVVTLSVMVQFVLRETV